MAHAPVKLRHFFSEAPRSTSSSTIRKFNQQLTLTAARGRVYSKRFWPLSSKWQLIDENGKVEEWDPGRRVGNPCSSPSVDSYPTFVSEEQKRVGVQVIQATPMLELTQTLVDLLSDMRSNAQAAGSLAECVSLTPRSSFVFFGFVVDAQGLRSFLYDGDAPPTAPSV